jgi:branched-chain amino acid aminotransferase
MSKVSLNGKIYPADEPVLLASNRGYRYGHGLFETMKVSNGTIMLEAFHFERLFSGLALLEYSLPALFTPANLREQILLLCEKNGCVKLGRVRLSVFPGNGGLYDDGDKLLQYLIECWTLEDTMNQLNENGLVLGVYEHARKSCDVFSQLKSANFLPYAMAAQYARASKLNDSLVLNIHDRIADATIANLFIVGKKRIITPPLREGCVNGVMRRRILESRNELIDIGYSVEELPLEVNDLLDTEEIFLTNAVYGIRWVKDFLGEKYPSTQTTEIYNKVIKTIHP